MSLPFPVDHLVDQLIDEQSREPTDQAHPPDFVAAERLVLRRRLRRGAEGTRVDDTHVLCACGCGAVIDDRDRHGRPRRFVYGHASRVVVPRRSPKPRFMTKREALAIAGPLSKPGKMPGHAYGLDPFSCVTGSAIARVEGSVCADCYARKGNYMRWPGVRQAWATRLAAITHERWIEAVAELIYRAVRDDGDPFFRWHDSGDLMSTAHLARIAEVAKLTPRVQHWLPTREVVFVDEYLRWHGPLPPNLCVRISAFHVGEEPFLLPLLKNMPTSTVNSVRGEPVQVSERRRDSIECRAYTRGGKCHKCRACWNPDVRNVSYPEH